LLHHDHYKVTAEKTALTFDSVWLARPGGL
jgi:hypothetical protein